MGYLRGRQTARSFTAGAVADGGAAEEGIAELRRGLAASEAMGIQQHTPCFLGLLAELCIGIRNYGEALKLVDEALSRVEKLEERWFEADLHRLKGEALLRCSSEHAAEAEGSFRTALAIAQQQSAELWKLRAATSLARLWLEHGKRRKARDLLVPIYDWFTEGFDTQDLKDAETLLKLLA
jgi:predicted ATPase